MLVKLWSEKLIKMFIIILVSVWLSSEAFYYPPVVRSELYNSILNSLEQKEISCFLFCDFSKAFDKVWHRGLIHKMNSYCIKGPLIKWFENYLYQRKQKVINIINCLWSLCWSPPRVSFCPFAILNLYKWYWREAPLSQ